jgi:hypothetical protein
MHVNFKKGTVTEQHLLDGVIGSVSTLSTNRNTF